MDGDRVRAVYRLWCESLDAASERTFAIAREQTVEVPAGVGGARLQGRLIGRVETVESTRSGAYDATVSYSLAVTGTGLVQLLNVVWGNVSLMNDVRLLDVVLPDVVRDRLPGPRHGIEGVRRLVGVTDGRPLVSVAIKPVGRSPRELAEIASAFARAGADVIKDDHGLADQPSAPFRRRVAIVAQAVREANAATGGRSVYAPNVTGPVDTLDDRLEYVDSVGCAGVLLCPSLTGLDLMRALAARSKGPMIMAHPTHAQSAPGRRDGMAPELLLGTLYRLAGADVVIYVNAGGRFAWPVETCREINARLRAPMGSVRPALPAPAGGVDAAEADRWLELYGPDTMLLVGGSLLAEPDLVGATRALVETARRQAPPPAAPPSSEAWRP